MAREAQLVERDSEDAQVVSSTLASSIRAVLELVDRSGLGLLDSISYPFKSDLL